MIFGYVKYHIWFSDPQTPSTPKFIQKKETYYKKSTWGDKTKTQGRKSHCQRSYRQWATSIMNPKGLRTKNSKRDQGGLKDCFFKSSKLLHFAVKMQYHFAHFQKINIIPCALLSIQNSYWSYNVSLLRKPGTNLKNISPAYPISIPTSLFSKMP